MEGRFDDMFFAIAQELGSIDRILLEFFGFLKRRTDFFVLANPGDRAGFPPGVAERMLYSVYKKFRDEHDREHPFVPRQAPEQAPAPVAEPERKVPEPPQSVEPPRSAEPADPAKAQISTYNGAATSRYSWSQDLTDVTVQAILPPGTKSKDLIVKITKDSLSVKLKSDPTNPIIEGQLFEYIHKDECNWYLDSGTIVIVLEKAKDSVWKTVIVGDEEIDPKQVDTARRVDEYDEETQMGIRKVMHEHDRKLKGLPSTDEEQAMDKLKEMWKNSELGDQPFDMARIGEILKYQPSDAPPEPE